MRVLHGPEHRRARVDEVHVVDEAAVGGDLRHDAVGVDRDGVGENGLVSRGVRADVRRKPDQHGQGGQHKAAAEERTGQNNLVGFSVT